MQDQSTMLPLWRVEAEESLTGFALEVYQRMPNLTTRELAYLFHCFMYELHDRREAQEAPRRAAERRATAERRKRWIKLRRIVLERDEHQCQYCGAPATSVDHMLPQSRGGTDDLSNLVAACRACNGGKRNKTADEWRRWLEARR